MAQVAISKTVTSGIPTGIPARQIAEALLPRNYDLSIVYIGDKRSRTLNRHYRGRDKPTNVLSFPIDAAHGEIYLCTPALAREHEAFGLSKRDFAAYLLIHGILHLKGHRHGGRMDAMEATWCKRFGLELPR